MNQKKILFKCIDVKASIKIKQKLTNEYSKYTCLQCDKKTVEVLRSAYKQRQRDCIYYQYFVLG